MRPHSRPALNLWLELFCVEFACSPDRLMLSMSAQVTLAKMCLFLAFCFWHFFSSFFWWKFSYFLPLGVHTSLLEYHSFLHDSLQGLQTNRQPPGNLKSLGNNEYSPTAWLEVPGHVQVRLLWSPVVCIELRNWSLSGCFTVTASNLQQPLVNICPWGPLVDGVANRSLGM